MISQYSIAHNGISHQKSGSQPQVEPSSSETNENQNKIDIQTISPKNTPKFQKQPTETSSDRQNLNTKIEVLDSATLVPGFGETIFILLIASPFLLLSFKKWLHR